MPTSLTARVRRPAVILAATAVFLGGLVPVVGAADGLDVTTPYPSIAVAPGSSASFDLTITSSQSGTVSLAVLGAPTGWKATIHGGGFVVQGVTAAPGNVDWPAYSGDTASTKYSPLDQITRNNVAGLTLAWRRSGLHTSQ